MIFAYSLFNRIGMIEFNRACIKFFIINVIIILSLCYCRYYYHYFYFLTGFILLITEY